MNCGILVVMGSECHCSLFSWLICDVSLLKLEPPCLAYVVL